MTAVEWLASNLDIIWEEKIIDLVEQAKEMEKQQIINAYEASEMNENEIKYKIVDGERFCSYENAEDYYNETFKK